MTTHHDEKVMITDEVRIEGKVRRLTFIAPLIR